MQFTFFEDGDKSMVLSLVGIKHIILKQGYSKILARSKDIVENTEKTRFFIKKNCFLRFFGKTNIFKNNLLKIRR